MTNMDSTDRLKIRAEQYFSRSSFSAPVFIEQHTVAFLDDRSGTPQVSVLNLTNGTITALTSFSERVQSLKGSTASKRILFGMDDGGNERQQLWTVGMDGGEPIRLTSASQSIHEPGCLSKDGNYVLYRSNARDEATFDVLGLSLDGGNADIWMRDGGQVDATDVHPDGDRILIDRINGNMDSDLLLVAGDGDVTNLTPHDGEQWLYGAVFNSDGTAVWMLSNLERDFVALMHLDLESGRRTIVYEAGWDVELFKVSPDGHHIALSVNQNGASKPVIIPTQGHGDGAVPIDVPVGVIDGFTWSPDSSHVVFGISTVENPSVLMMSDTDGATHVVADAASESGIQHPETFAPELVHYTTWDGRTVPGFFFKPGGDGPFPVLVDVHGGPESQRRLNYTPSGPIFQYLTSLGIAVLTLNVRGSTGYGKEYTHLDDKELRLDSVKDVASSVEWLRTRPDVIGDKIAVMGQSYGGFMTLASLVFHPTLWTCAVDVVGIANFVSFMERTGPWRRKHRAAEYGDLENDRKLLERISPLNYIDNVEAPLLVIHGRNDPRVPLYEAEQVVQALQERGREVELKVYDDEGHGLSKRPNRIDGYATAGAFLMRHFGLQ